MAAHVLVPLGAAVLAGGLTAVLIRLMFPLLERYALARPNARSSHKVPTAQGGGAAVIAAIILVSTAMLALGSAPSGVIGPGVMVTVFAVAAGLAVMGAVDDIRPLPVRMRLALQVAAAGLLVAVIPASLRALPLVPAIVESAILTIGLVWFVNLVNFMDGIDEITVAEMVPVAGALAVLGVAGALPAPGGLVAACLAGALLGFWPWNRHVARLFLGDVGSLAIGALSGWLLILLAGNGHLAAALILPLYYLADATVTLYQRWRRGERISQAHRTHYYQRAASAGWSVPEVTGMVLVTNAALVVLACATVWAGSRLIDGAALVLGGLVTHRLMTRLVRGPR